jgi:primosomal protein N''
MAVLEKVQAAQQSLVLALDAGDAGAIEAAAAALADSIDTLKTEGAPDGAEAAVQADIVRRLFDESQMRVNFLTDVVRRRLDRLASLGGRDQVPVYAREGR